MSEENKENNQQESAEGSKPSYNYDFKDDISAFGDVELECKAILGSARMSVGQFLKITRGSILELDKKLDEDLDILVNNYKIAEGGIQLHDDIIGIEIKRTYKRKKY